MNLNMKKTAACIAAFTMLSGMTACGNASTRPSSSESSTLTENTRAEIMSEEIEITTEKLTQTEEPAQTETVKENNRILICYFSFPETYSTDASAGASRVVIDGEMKGAMQYMAEIISDETGGDLFRIETIQEYPGTHEPLVDQASEEKAESARPGLSVHIENPDDYDTVFIGYPNWWGDMPMPLYTFLEEYDFSGKTIIPFNSHGGSGFSRTIETIAEYEPEASVVIRGFSVSRENVSGVESDLRTWVQSLGIKAIISK